MNTDRDRSSLAAGLRLFRRMRLRISEEQRTSIYKSISDSSHVDVEYVTLLILAGLIALFGLLENSPAVIIGAMLISPLMNPILSAALALLLGDGKLGKRSAIVLVFSIGGVIGITWLVASLTPLKQATPEIFARTAPTLLDLFIAFLSGLAGTLALRGGSVALTILPGVAIAVAVVPPLSVVGYGLSTHQGSIAGGAFLLFVTNLVSIIISAAVVFRVMGFRPHQEAEKGRWKLKYRLAFSLTVLLLLSIPLFLTLRKAAIQVSIRSEVQRDLKAAFDRSTTSVSDLSFSQMRDGLSVRATLRTTRYVETKMIESAEKVLRKKFGPGTTLLIDQILVTQGGVTAAEAAQAPTSLLGGVVRPVEQKTPFDFKESSMKNLEFVRRELDSVLAGTLIQQEASPEVVLAATPPRVLRLQLASPEPLSSQTLSLLAAQLEPKLGLPVQLHGRIELRGPSFQLTMVPPKPGLGLTADDRLAVRKLIALVQQDNLRLQVLYTTESETPSGKQVPRVVSEIRGLLSRSRLKGSQWTIEAAPNASAADKTGEKGSQAAAPGPFRCELKVFQDF